MHNVRKGNTVWPVICGHSFGWSAFLYDLNILRHNAHQCSPFLWDRTFIGPYLTNQESLKPHNSFYCTTQSDIHYYADTTEPILIDEWRPSPRALSKKL